MYVLADLEWVEKNGSSSFLTQIAMLRVDEKWQPVSSIYRRIRPAENFPDWTHIAFTGGLAAEYRNAPDIRSAFSDISEWLLPEDVICWWYQESRDRLKSKAPMIENTQIVLNSWVKNFIGGEGGNPYVLGKRYCVEAPGPAHDSRSDVEMMRRVLEYFQFLQFVPERASEEDAKWIYVKSMAYHAHVDTNTIHKRGCPKIPAAGQIKGYNVLTKPVKKGYMPCDCIKAEFRAARRVRNQNIIDRSKYNYLYSANSRIFHSRDCKLILSAKTINGSEQYKTCLKLGLSPCKVCNPSPQTAAIRKSKADALSPDEERAIKRHRQARERRTAVERNPALSMDEREDLCTLSSSGYTFFAAKGCKNFHLRNCKKLSGAADIKGFALYEDAVRAGHRPCKHCKPTEKQDALISLPIYSRRRTWESMKELNSLCKAMGLRHREENGKNYIETETGIWRIDTDKAPYRLAHINLIKTPHNRTQFHRQPRLFLSLSDIVYYIKRHDDSLALVWKETEYEPAKM